MYYINLTFYYTYRQILEFIFLDFWQVCAAVGRKSFYDLFQSWLQRSFLNNAVESCHRIRLSNIAWNSLFYSKVVSIGFNLIKVSIYSYIFSFWLIWFMIQSFKINDVLNCNYCILIFITNIKFRFLIFNNFSSMCWAAQK